MLKPIYKFDSLYDLVAVYRSFKDHGSKVIVDEPNRLLLVHLVMNNEDEIKEADCMKLVYAILGETRIGNIEVRLPPKKDDI